MARITVEDCVKVVPNRFKLCIIASNRARSIMSGAETESIGKEKPSVTSLREIAEGRIDVEVIEENIIKDIKERNGFQYSSNKDSQDQINSVFAEEGEFSRSPSSASFVSESVDVDD